MTATKSSKSTGSPKTRSPGGAGQEPLEVEVRLEFVRPAADAVFVAGTFNEWRPAVTPMIRIADGRWIKQLRLPPGRYEYCLVVDGEWMPDPSAAESVLNPFGGFNSVFHVVLPDRASAPAR